MVGFSCPGLFHPAAPHPTWWGWTNLARPQHKLTGAELRAKTPGEYADGGGLWFHRRADGGAQWFLRYTPFGRRHEIGLRCFPVVSLK
ncbi:MAG: Arm DNA-binding domain-containing protein, partial [Pseudomonadota bacterium]